MAARSTSKPEPFRCGAIAVIGRPNVGKSTLVNALVGAKVSIVAPKPQTTRHRILGVATRAHAQLVLLDTPGLHRKEPRAINRQLNRTARAACTEAHAVLLVCEAARWTDEDDAALDIALACGLPVVLALNKVDKLADKRTLLPRLGELAARHTFAALVPISASKRDGLDVLEQALMTHLPQGDAMFEADAITDRSERFLAAELIREQVVRQLHEELPFSATVEVERFKQTKARTEIAAVIWVERAGQKAIVVGRGGAQIKKIGMAARKELESMVGGPVFLELWARVREQWSDDEAALRRFGYAE
jgi:GTP-binding protein Era